MAWMSSQTSKPLHYERTATSSIFLYTHIKTHRTLSLKITKQLRETILGVPYRSENTFPTSREKTIAQSTTELHLPEIMTSNFTACGTHVDKQLTNVTRVSRKYLKDNTHTGFNAL
ncbi:hypothetical protein CEXT_190981 [Caerostris extrusa]|uniref:Uncharacterized protein n=1 Tax=Caerostris extrusa TaxID=172846 RepID=A0AAV4QEQ6_CAEEX|nr:hypothetical protein CEXT_190981 [Caerostris extrusa]